MGKGDKRPVLVAGRGPHGGLAQRMVQYLEWMRERNSTAQGLRGYEYRLTGFLLWCEERGLERAEGITLRVLESWQRHLYQSVKRNGEPLSVVTQHTRLSTVKSFFSWLTRRHWLPSNPASELEMPRLGQQLPKDVLSVSEVETLLNWPDITRVEGVRDRAMLELLYSTGMRRGELAGLTLHSINHEQKTVMICQGKGGKDRLIPAGERACCWVRRYEEQSRPALVRAVESGSLFLAKNGQGYSLEGLSHHIGTLLRQSGVRQSGSCHLMRHSMATHMLENGADTRWIQAMLGHSKLETTQIYTRVSIRALKEIHTATHPAECKGPLDEV